MPTPLQQRLWSEACRAHDAGDRADARVLHRMSEAIDEGDYAAVQQLAQTLREVYRTRLGTLPAARAHDAGA